LVQVVLARLAERRRDVSTGPQLELFRNR